MLKPKTREFMVFQIIGLLCVIALGFFSIIGSGGGGSGGGGGPVQAVIDSDAKAQSMARGAFVAGELGSSLFPIGAVVMGEDDGGATSFMPLSITRALESATLQVDFSNQAGRPYVGAIQSFTDTVFGPCGGQADYTLQFDDNDPVTDINLFGTFTFLNYCDQGTIISGTATVNCVMDMSDPTVPVFKMISFSFKNLTTGSITLAGSIDIVYTSASVTDITFDASITEKGLVYQVENYVLKLTEDTNDMDGSGSPDWIDLQIVSGRYYHPTYGYVKVSTTVDFSFVESNGYTWPESGILLGHGANLTQFQLEALDTTQCRITADYDGDGVLDDYAGPDPIDWTSL